MTLQALLQQKGRTRKWENGHWKLFDKSKELMEIVDKRFLQVRK